ncbi:Trace amine-associated receptor 6 [Liparis tanakae]|uniref:Trace amine-associated receptor 6 n=1 Tax=Liparis tanakae TaxID=230148 RepID=A0A4Z2G630_9TELE|nr:Trace amine-associated receptor 6 [Liparis tanakae]
MFRFILYLAALVLLKGASATNQTFTSSGEMDITSCPITYYGQKYDRVYIEQVELGNFGTQAILAIKTYSGYQDVDVGQPDRAVLHPSDMNQQLNESDCCVLNAVCSVTGSTVIDFVGRVQSVPDRCGYTLMQSSLFPGLTLLAVFQERRRKDVSFVDRLILQLEGVQISMEQSGRVLLDDKVLTLNNTAQVVHGVELSRDQTGVTAKISPFDYAVSILFDGYTTIIHMTVVCCVLSHSCEMQYDEAPDSTINCNATTKWCNLLKQAPFAACNKHINPEPFITACTNTLCKYPAVDGLKCQNLEAYARACNRHGNVKMESWRETTNCPAVPEAFCKDRFCSAHEFCGQRNVGEHSCLCRAIFASKYRSTDTFGEPTVCQQSSTSISLANCLLEDKSIDYSSLHLNDQACKGQMDNLTHMVMFKADGNNTCGMVVRANDSQVIYKNTISSRKTSATGLIHRHNGMVIDVSCFYNQPDVQTYVIDVQHSTSIQKITSGEWNYNLTMTAYTDPDRMNPIQSSNNIQMNQKIWVELKTDGLDERIVHVVTDSCWATDQPSPSGSLRYDLIIKGCPNPTDDTVKVEDNGMGTSNYFSFNTFQFSDMAGSVYLHCRLELCVMQDDACVPLNSSCEKPTQPANEALLIYVLLSLISVITVTLNLLVIISISHFRQLHCPTNLLILSLAVSDLLVGLLLMPVEIIYIEDCWFLGDVLCTVYYLIDYIITAASVANMVLISVDRYIAICDPLRYPTRVTKRRAQYCVCLCWIWSIIFRMVLLHDHLEEPGRSNSCFGECVVVINYAAGVADLVFTFIIPIVVIIVLYMRVFLVAVSQARAMRSHVAMASTAQRSGAVTVKKTEMKAARTLGFVILVFLCCFCPYYYPALAGEDTSIDASSASFEIWLAHFNSSVTLTEPWSVTDAI